MIETTTALYCTYTTKCNSAREIKCAIGKNKKLQWKFHVSYPE